MIGSLEPKAAGRPGKPPALSELAQRLRRLERENARLKKRVEATDELLGVAGSLLHGQRQPGQRSRRVRKSRDSDEGAADSEPEGRRAGILDAVAQMHRLGLTIHRAASLAGVDAATVRRWRGMRASIAHRDTRKIVPALIEQVDHRVRQLHGLIGAAALSHAVVGLSRRVAARLKANTLSAMERERQHALTRISVTRPGVMRGCDAMYVMTRQGARYALICADAAVPYRTALVLGEHYDTALVARTLEADFAVNGAPLILRADRARAHDSPRVRQILERHQVLMLHGPPRYPCFYGQLERQNREHRAWLAALIDPLGPSMRQLLTRMIYCLNTLWPRRSLGWKTAAEVWEVRTPINVDRAAFKKEVHDRARHIERSFDLRGKPADMVERLAIEQTLVNMGYLHRQIGAKC
jgi:transposase InsO family protein